MLIELAAENANLTSFIQPKQFGVVLASVKKVAVTHTYTTPTLALKLGHTLRKSVKLC